MAKLAVSTQALIIIERHRRKQIEQAAVKMVRLTRKSTGAPRLWSDRANWTDRIGDLGMPKAAGRLVASKASLVDRSPAATEARQNKLVDALCAGNRCSLRRAYKIAGYGHHAPSLDQLLETVGIRERFRYHALAGHPLPAKFRLRILFELGIDAIGLQEDLIMLGLADP